ncbi:MAG: HDOD domain-containing protein [Dehalococcoidia bacterium]
MIGGTHAALTYRGTPMPEQLDLHEFVAKVNQIAPLPAVALKVLQLAEDDRTSAQDLASALATDQALTAKLLRLANSAYFAAGREIATVRDAVVLLGMVEVRRLVLTTALMGRFNDDSGRLSIPAFWGHALAVGMVAEVMARQTNLARPEEAFTAGILHDIGKLVMNQYAREHFEAAAGVATEKGIPLERAEAEVFGFSHPALGFRLAEIWRLPPALCDAIAEHHAQPETDHGLAYLVAKANSMARDHGLWCGFDDIEPGAEMPAEVVEDPLRAAALARLGGFEGIVERANSFLMASPLTEARRSNSRPANVTDFPRRETPPQQPARSGLRAAMAAADRFPGRFRR